MHVAFILPLVAGFLTMTQAATTIKICKDSGLRGDCVVKKLNSGVCWNFPADYNDKVSSMEVLGGRCDFFGHGGCRESVSDMFDVSGRKNTIPGRSNDELSSVRC